MPLPAGAAGPYPPLRPFKRILKTSRNIRAESLTMLTRLLGELYHVTGTSATR